MTTIDAQSTVVRSAQYTLWIYSATLLVLAGSFLIMPGYSDTQDAYGYALRVTARLGFTLFLLTYLARPLVAVTGMGKVLVRHRRHLGVSAAIVMTIHFGYVVATTMASDTQLDLPTIVVGGGAFVWFWIMAATSNRFAVRALGKAWKVLHRIGMHWIWFVFFVTWIGRVADAPVHWIAVAPMLIGLGMRIWLFYRGRSAR